MVSGEVEPAVSLDEGVHQKRDDAGVFAGLAAGGMAIETLWQFMLRIPKWFGRSPVSGKGQIPACAGMTVMALE